MMTVNALYLACANLHSEANIRVYDKNDLIYRGRFVDMTDEVRNRKVIAFDIDYNFSGCVICVHPL